MGNKNKKGTKVRKKSAVAKDLRTPKYKMRVVKSKKEYRRKKARKALPGFGGLSDSPDFSYLIPQLV